MRSITSANAVIMLAVTGLFDVPQQLQKFGPDAMFSTEPIQTAETAMGVDGFLAAGFVFNEIAQNFTLQADSESNDLFDAWYAQEQVLEDKLRCNAVILLPSLSRKWTMTNGVMKTWPPMPDGAKVLQVRRFGITWESASPSPA